MHLKYTAAMVLMLSGFVFAPIAFSDIIVTTSSGRQIISGEPAVEAGESAGAADSEASGEEEEKTSPEDELVAKLVEIKFERTPATILKAWSEEHRKKEDPDTEGQEEVRGTRAERDATVASRFGEVLVLKLGEVKDSEASLKLKADVAVVITSKDDDAKKIKATVVSVDAENLVLKMTPAKPAAESSPEDSNERAEGWGREEGERRKRKGAAC